MKIVNPAKVERSALQNAASIAAMVITTEVLVADKPEEKRRRWAPKAWAAWAVWGWACKPAQPLKLVNTKRPRATPGSFLWKGLDPLGGR